MASIDSLARVVRSKNSSPFDVTVDIFFDDPVAYNKVKNSGIISIETVAKLYGLSPDQIEGIFYVDQALGIKITMAKEYPSDHFLSRDCYGAHQHIPFLSLEIPE